VAPAQLGFAARADSTNTLEALVDRYERKWRDNATRASPLIDYAYAWARREARREAGATVVVHGDAGPYNFLIDEDRLTAVLDWEFAHLGDPAEDLGIVRIYAENVLDWQEFLDLYAAAGGALVPEHRVRLGMVLQFLKGTTLVATSGRNFEEGWTREFVKGASSFTGLRLIEQRIAQLLERFEAL
jgi:aminoglycoside phosphotransferase (APT) family kinase protein